MSRRVNLASAQQAAPGEAERIARVRFVSFVSLVERYAVVLVWALMLLAFSLLESERFLTTATFRIIFSSQSVLLLLTLAPILVLVVGEFDLSPGALLGFANTLFAVLNVVFRLPLAVALTVTLAAGTLVGIFHAFTVTRISVPSVVTTLGSGTLLIGLTQLVSQNKVIAGVSPELVQATNTPVLGLAPTFYYALTACAVTWYVLQHTPLGRHLYLVGESPEVARLVGLRVERLRAGALVASAIISTAAGVLLTGQLASATPDTGQTFLLPAIAATFLGATTIQPGRFNVWGTFIAVYFLITGFTGLQLAGLAGWVQDVFYGGSLIVAVIFARLVKRGRDFAR